MTPAQVAERVAASRADQGLPARVQDDAALAKVAAVLASANRPRKAA